MAADLIYIARDLRITAIPGELNPPDKLWCDFGDGKDTRVMLLTASLKREVDQELLAKEDDYFAGRLSAGAYQTLLERWEHLRHYLDQPGVSCVPSPIGGLG